MLVNVLEMFSVPAPVLTKVGTSSSPPPIVVAPESIEFVKTAAVTPLASTVMEEGELIVARAPLENAVGVDHRLPIERKAEA